MEFQIYHIFVPYMLGTISLIAFLSLRNTHLAKGARDLCDKILDKDRSTNPAWGATLFLEVGYFYERYLMSNRALQFAIASVVFFGIMILVSYLSAKGISLVTLIDLHAYSDHPEIAFLFIGGLLATYATIRSISETANAVRSISTHIASTVIHNAWGKNISDTYLIKHLSKIESLTKNRINSTLEGQL